MSDGLYPIGYGNSLVTLDRLYEVHGTRMIPQFAERIFPWIEAQNGHIGIGGGYRPFGTQPNRPGFAPEGKSFHQPQFSILHSRIDGRIVAIPSNGPDGRYAAVDLVARTPGGKRHRAPYWREVPAQGSAEALRWGVHCNISSESWHMQPLLSPDQPNIIDGFDSWVRAGKPIPIRNYPIPAPEKDDEMFTPIAPIRTSDTRRVPGVPIFGHHEFQFNHPSIPQSATAVMFTITVPAFGVDQGGHVSVGPIEQPDAELIQTSVINPQPGVVKANTTVVKVTTRRYKVFSLHPTHVVIDVIGYWT